MNNFDLRKYLAEGKLFEEESLEQIIIKLSDDIGESIVDLVYNYIPEEYDDADKWMENNIELKLRKYLEPIAKFIQQKQQEASNL